MQPIANSLAEPDIRMYSVLLCTGGGWHGRSGGEVAAWDQRRTKRVSPSSAVRIPASATYQLLNLLLGSGRPQLGPPQLGPPPLELFVGHELKRPVRDADEREDHALGQPAHALLLGELMYPVCGPHAKSVRRNGERGWSGPWGEGEEGGGGSRKTLRYARGSSAREVNMRVLTTHIGFVITAVTKPVKVGSTCDRSEGA